MVLLLPNQPIIIIRTPPSHFLKEYQEGKTERCESKSPYITYDTPLPAAASFSWIPDPKERSSWGPGSTGSATEGTNGDKDRTRRTWTSDLSLNFTISSSPSFFSPRIYLAWTPRLFFFFDPRPPSLGAFCSPGPEGQAEQNRVDPIRRFG